MSEDFDKLRQLLLDAEQSRIEALQTGLSQTQENVPDLVAGEIERGLQEGAPTRLNNALTEATIHGIEQAVQRKPETVVNAMFPVIGPAIRRALQEAMHQLSTDIDRAVNDALSTRAWKWRLEAWRSGVSYAQVMLRHTVRWRVEHLFLIQPESGLLQGHLTAPELPELDADAIAGMFTAIHSFVNDSMQATSQNGEGGIGFAKVGDYQLVVSEGPKARLVAFVRGVPGSDFPTRLDEINEALHAQKSSLLADSAGMAGAGLLETTQLDALNTRDEPATSGNPNSARYLRWALLALAVVLSLWWGMAHWRWKQAQDRWNTEVADIREHLFAQPGVFITQLDAAQRGELKLHGLRDPLAPDIKAWLEQNHPEVKSQWNLRPFVSLEPPMIAARVAQAMAVPQENVTEPDAQGVVKLQGAVAFATWQALTQAGSRSAVAAPLLPGVSSIDISGLHYINQSRIETLSGKLNNLIPSFTGDIAPDAQGASTLVQMMETLKEIQALGGRDMAFVVQTAGLADITGDSTRNAELRLQRAQWLAEQLQTAVRPPSRVEVNQATAERGANPDQRGARAIITQFFSETPAAKDAK